MVGKPTDVVEQIGKEYVEQYDVVPDDGRDLRTTVRSFKTMGKRNAELFDQIPVPVHFQADDPYDDFQDMRDTVDDEGILRVFDGGSEHPIWGHKSELHSRAVHDWYGHLELDVDFSPIGEYRKWERASRRYPAYCARVLFTEVVGQLGAVYYLPDGFADDRYEQKVFPAPTRWIEDMARAVELHGDQL